MYDKRRNNRPHGRNQHYIHSRPPFDVYMVEDFFPRVGEAHGNENDFLQALLKRNNDLTPTPEEQTNLVNLVSKVQMILENIALSPDLFDTCQIEEVRVVGSFKRGTMRTGHNVADMVVILKSLPITESIKALGAKVFDEIVKNEPSLSSQLQLENVPGGFSINNSVSPLTVRVLVATIPPNMRKLDSNAHVPVKLLQRHMAAVRHVRWFEENANSTVVKGLIRVLRDVCSRYNGLNALTPWMVDVLAHYSITFRPNGPSGGGPLQLGAAFKRVFQLLAGGLFLPGSTGIPDPCENGAHVMHQSLTFQQQDDICATCQTLLRVMAYGMGYKAVLGLERDTFGVTENMSVWDGVVVAPSNPAYEAPASKEDEPEKNTDEEVEKKVVEATA